MRIKNDGSQLYSYYIQSPQSPGSIIMGAQSIGLTNTTSYPTVSTATWTTSTRVNYSGDNGLSVSPITLGLTTMSLDSVTGGQSAYTVAGTYSWICPAGVTSVSAVCVGGGSGGNNVQSGGGGGGGGLGYANNMPVTPGTSYTVTVGSGGPAGLFGSVTAAQASSFIDATGYGGGNYGSGGGFAGNGGGYGGNGGWYSGGGGAGGYGNAGGNGGGDGQPGSPGANGSAGGGGGSVQVGNSRNGSYGGGGVSLLGRGNNGQGGSFTGTSYTGGSGGGSNPVNLIGGSFGGAGWGGGISYNQYCCCNPYDYSYGGPGRDGAVRIIWPGNTRTFPTTNTQTP